MKLAPLKDFVIVNIVKEKSLIATLNDEASKDPKAKVFVTAIGPEVKEVKVGDRVLVLQGIYKTEIDGNEVYFTKEENINMIIGE